MLFRVPGMDAMIYCKDGQCKFVNPTDLLLNHSDDDDIGALKEVPFSTFSLRAKFLSACLLACRE
jgi:hypothetical protein